MFENFNINFMLIIVWIAVVYKGADGCKKGMVKEIISFVSLIVLCIVGALIAGGVNNYFDGKYFNVAVMVFLLALVGIIHHLLGLAFFTAKLVAKLPVIHSVDKLLGIVFGVLEVVLILWTVYTLIMMMDMGAIGQVVLSYTESSKILAWFYQHNYLAYGIECMMEKFDFVPLEELKSLFGSGF